MVDNRIHRLKRVIPLILTLATISILAVFSLGEPQGADSMTALSNQTQTLNGPNSFNAIAGNVTELLISTRAPTKAWQGYYGNISGTISLENAAGDVFYDWLANEPEGEIYASTNNTIFWESVKCFQYVNGTEPNVTTEEARYGMDPDDVDGINDTFNVTTHVQFFVGTVNIAANSCPSTYVYTNSNYQTNDWQNVLLLDTVGNSLIFTSVIENRDPANDTDKLGFDNRPFDFQLLVAEDEHNTTSAGPTTYYFWVEIE